jgi:hypothetical protein
VPESIYNASYPMRVFSTVEFFESLAQWVIVAKIPSPEGYLKNNSGLDIDFQGFILKRKYDK